MTARLIGISIGILVLVVVLSWAFTQFEVATWGIWDLSKWSDAWSRVPQDLKNIALVILVIVAVTALLIFVADFRKVVLPFVGIAIIIGAVALWLGWDNSLGIGRDIGGGLKNFTAAISGESPSGSGGSCGEKELTLLPGEPVTVERDNNCSRQLQMTWGIPVSSHVDISGNGNLGSYHYVRYPHKKSTFEYAGFTQTITFTNLGTEPTSALILYK